MLPQIGVHGRAFLVVSALGALIAGCAGTPPEPKFSHTIVAGSRVASSDTAEVTIDAADDVKMLPVERDRVAQKVKARIDARKAVNTATPPARDFQVVVHVTRYEKGSKFARAMLAGLGQIHFEGTISVYQMPERTLVGEFDMQKTFAWGGIYGASTSIEEIEDTFADAVAATVTGQQRTTPKASAT